MQFVFGIYRINPWSENSYSPRFVLLYQKGVSPSFGAGHTTPGFHAFFYPLLQVNLVLHCDEWFAPSVILYIGLLNRTYGKPVGFCKLYILRLLLHASCLDKVPLPPDRCRRLSLDHIGYTSCKFLLGYVGFYLVRITFNQILGRVVPFISQYFDFFYIKYFLGLFGHIA